MAFQIVTDSCADLDLAIRTRYGIDYLKMRFQVEGKEYPASLDWEDCSAKEFYDRMRSGKRVFTSQVPVEEFRRVFTPILSKGEDILYIGCSSALSASVKLASSVGEELLKDYPGRKIVVVDSLISSLGEGSMTVAAAKLREEGKSLEEIACWLSENKLRFQQCGTVETMDYLRQAGRVKASKAFFGNLLGVKPIIISDALGNNLAVSKVKGRRTSLMKIAEYIGDVIEDAENQTVFVSHADAPEEAAFLRDAIVERTGAKEAYLNVIGPIVGASVGPGTVIAFCFGRKVEITGEV